MIEAIPDVNDWKDVLVVVIIVAGGWVTTLITVRRGQRKAHSAHNDLNSKVDEVLGQTRNGHDVPLREDIDRLIDGQRRTNELLSDTHRLVVGHDSDIREMKDDIKQLQTAAAENQDRVATLPGRRGYEPGPARKGCNRPCP